MALMYCPECGGTVSSSARSCPHCGCPFDAPTPPPEPDNVGFVAYQAPPRVVPGGRVRTQTVEQTGKFWKSQILLSALLLIGGVVAAVIGSQDKGANNIGGFGGLAIFLGLLWLIFAKVGAWWFHG